MQYADELARGLGNTDDGALDPGNTTDKISYIPFYIGRKDCPASAICKSIKLPITMETPIIRN